MSAGYPSGYRAGAFTGRRHGAARLTTLATAGLTLGVLGLMLTVLVVFVSRLTDLPTRRTDYWHHHDKIASKPGTHRATS